MKRADTRSEYEERLRGVVHHLLANLDAPLDLAAMAAWSNVSPFHFHRVFQALLGESPVQMVRRLRLERAADALRSTQDSVGEIAVNAGYATHAAFIRSFREAFAISPSDFRKHLTYDGRLPSLNRVHYFEASLSDLRFCQGDNQVQIETRNHPGMTALCLPHHGPYYMIGQTFGKLGSLLPPGFGPGIAIYYDEPNTTPVEKLRSHAGFIVVNDLGEYSPELELIEIPEGVLAVTVHEGPYDTLTGTWSQFYGQTIEIGGYSLADSPGLEVYLNDCAQVAPSELRTELWLRLKPTA